MSRVATALLVFSLSLSGASALAGDVLASVTGGTLTLAGSAATDQVSIDQIGVANAKQFRVVPGVGTTVNGSAVPQLFSPITKDVAIALGAGSDSVTIVDSKLPRDLVGESVAANITDIELDRCRVARHLVGKSNGGSLELNVRATVVGGDVRLVGGGQEDEILLAQDTLVRGNVVFRGDDGSDDLICNQSAIVGSVRFDGGAADDGAQLSQATIGGDVRFAGGAGPDSVQVSSCDIGRMRIDLGDGDDGIVISATAVHGPLRANLGADANECASDHLAVAGALDIRGGGGPDSVHFLEGCSIERDLKVSLGDGANELVADTIFVAGGIRARSGLGADDLSVLDSVIRRDVRFAPSPTAAITVDVVTVADSIVLGNIRFDAASALDATVDGCDVARAVSARFGSGSNSIAIPGSIVGGVSIKGVGGAEELELFAHTHVIGNVTAKLGDGPNKVKLLTCSVGGDVFAKTGSGDDVFDFTGAVIGGKTTVASGGGADVGP